MIVNYPLVLRMHETRVTLSHHKHDSNSWILHAHTCATLGAMTTLATGPGGSLIPRLSCVCHLRYEIRNSLGMRPFWRKNSVNTACSTWKL